MDKKILIYAQDVGGAKCMAPVINQIVDRHQAMVVVHPLSESIFNENKIAYYPLSKFFDNSPPAAIEIGSFLHENKISHLFCSLSSSYRDLTNSNLIEICRALKIPTLGMMDHWKGYDRFFDESEEMSYFPDYIGCIDDFCKREILELCNAPERIFIVGHPHLERVITKRQTIKKSDRTINILIISQPDTRDFHSIFLKKIGSESVAGNIFRHIRTLDDGMKITINYRPHPKEKTVTHMPAGIHLTQTEKWEDALRENDIFIGLDSMLLVEAALAGKHCISLNIPDFSDLKDSPIPYKLWEHVDDLSALESAIKKAIKKLQSGSPVNFSEIERKIAGSLDRSLNCFEHFIKSSEKRNPIEAVQNV